MSDQERIFLTHLTIQNVKRVSYASWDLRPGLLRLTSGGKNRQGKSSTLQAIRMLFQGAGAVPDVARNKDADPDDRSFVRGCLSNGWTIQRHVTEKGSYLKVVGPDGLQGKQSHINKWRGQSSADPMGFYALSEIEQADRLLSLANDPQLKEKLEANAAKEQELRDARTPLISEQRRLRGAEEPQGERPEPIDVSAEMKRLDELQEEADAQEAIRESIRLHGQKVVQLEGNTTDLGHSIDEAKAEIKRLQGLIAKWEDKQTDLQAEIEDHQRQKQKAEAELDSRPDVSSEADQVRARIRQADAVQRQLEPWREYERAQKRLQEVEQAKKEHDRAIQEAQEERQAILAEASFPIEGLDLTPEGTLLMNGVPLSQASDREKVQIALHAAIYDNPKLGVILHDEGSDIDAEGLEEINQFCLDNDLQLILCRIGLEGPGELEIIDGQGSGELSRDEEEGDDE